MRSPVASIIDRVLDDVRDDRSGAVADYLPYLREVDPDRLGICLATVDGHVYEAGDSRSPLWLQSISKPFTYGLALADRGRDAVDARIDVEPSGDAYNEISLDERTHKPRNPMINAGAIAAASLVAGESLERRCERVLAHFSAYAGRDLSVDEDLYAAELETGHRNRAIGHLLRWGGIVTGDPDAALALYTYQCAVRVDCRDLSLMAATLANGGVNPRTGTEVLPPDLVERVLSVMTTCGMYDGAGAWVAEVGMPAKSGVAGGVIAVLPGQVGIGVFSPRLDERGNSVRGLAASRALSRELELHMMHVERGARAAVRASYDVRAAPSLRRRTDGEQAVLARVGDKAQVFELHGDLLFAGAESVSRLVCERAAELDLVVFDVRRVDEVSDVARRMLAELRDTLRAAGKDGVLVDPQGTLSRPRPDGDAVRTFRTRDAAVSWCEDRLLARYGTDEREAGPLPLSEHPLFDDLDDDAVALLTEAAEQRRYADGDPVLVAGQPSPGLHLITSGQVRVARPDAGGRPGRRIATLSAGMMLGERALASGDLRETDAVADGEVTVALLSAQAFDRLQDEHPQVAIALWRAVVREAHVVIDRFAQELADRSEAAT